MKHCIDEEGKWPDASADVSSDQLDRFLAHAKVCEYHAEILDKEFEKELRSIFRHARGLDDEGRILRGDELQHTIAEHERRTQEWEAVGMKESPFGLIALYNGGRLIAGTGKFRNYTFHRALHDLDPRAGLQIRARCSKDKDEEALLGYYALQDVRHNGESLFLPLDNDYVVGVKVKEIGKKSFEVDFQCFDESLKKSPSRVFVSNEPLPAECPDELKRLILEIRHLAKKQRYEKALACAKKANRIAPGNWRVRITLGTMLVMSGEIDDGDKIFQQALEDFGENPRAVAAAKHSSAWVKEIRCELDPSEDDLREVAHLYDEALQLDSSLADTRACLYVSLPSNETDKKQRLLEDSVLCEGFLDALQFELAERGVAFAHNVLQSLPARLRNLLSPVDPNYGVGYGY